MQPRATADDTSFLSHVFYRADTYVLGDSVGHLLHHVMAAMRREIELAMAAHDLTAAQWMPLWKLKLGAASTAQELSKQMDADAGSMTRLLDRLEAKGLIERERSAADRRVVKLRLTAAGEGVARHIPAVLCDVQNRFLAGFSPGDWELLKSLLRRMLANCPKVQADDAGASDAASAASAASAVSGAGSAPGHALRPARPAVGRRTPSATVEP